MKSVKIILVCAILKMVLSSDSCNKNANEPMDINSEGRLDYNLFQLNPNWQHMISTGSAPDPTKLCPCNSDNPADWKNSSTCTTQNIYMNQGKSCPNLGGHVNWFPVTYQGSLFWADKSNAGSDDDYNFNMRRNDRALYTGTNDHIRLEFDSDETVDHWDNTDVFWERFHHEVDNDDRNGSILVKGQFAIVIGLVGLDGGHDAFDSEIHPVYGLFMHAKDDPNDDRWSFFIRNWGNEGWCSSGQEYLNRSVINVVLPHENFNDVIMDNPNMWINNWTSDMTFSYQKCKEGVLLTFTFDDPEKKGCFFGDIGFKWTGENVTKRNDFNQNPIGAPFSRESESREMNDRDGDESLMKKIDQLNPESKKQLLSLLNGSTHSEKYRLFPKPTLTKVTEIRKVQTNLENIENQIATAKRKKSIPDYSHLVRSEPDSATAIRKQLRQQLIKKFLAENNVH